MADGLLDWLMTPSAWALADPATLLSAQPPAASRDGSRGRRVDRSAPKAARRGCGGRIEEA
jgi:hypothetical protein